MSRTLKWVLGIVAVLVIVAVIAGAAWFFVNRGQMMANFRPYATQPNQQAVPNNPNGQNNQNGPKLPNGQRGFNNNGRNPMGEWGFRGPMMGGRGRFSRVGPFGMGFMFLGGLLRWIIPLGILALVAFLFYQLGKRSRSVVAPATRREVASTDEPGPDAPKNA
jgi:hypothetical protein